MVGQNCGSVRGRSVPAFRRMARGAFQECVASEVGPRGPACDPQEEREPGLIIYRDGNSPVIKETMDLQSLSLESIKVKETGGTFRFRLHDNEDGFSDWGTTSEALRTEWLNKLIAAGCKIMATDMKVNERIRSDTLDAQAKEIGMDTCPVDYGGSVFVLKSSRQVLSGSWKKRVLRIKGTRYLHFPFWLDLELRPCFRKRSPVHFSHLRYFELLR